MRNRFLHRIGNRLVIAVFWRAFLGLYNRVKSISNVVRAISTSSGPSGGARQFGPLRGPKIIDRAVKLNLSPSAIQNSLIVLRARGRHRLHDGLLGAWRYITVSID